MAGKAAANDGWEDVSVPSATKVLFDTIGDVFTGTYVEMVHISPPDGEDFDLYHFEDADNDGELCAITPSYKLRQAMEAGSVKRGDLVRITYRADIPIQGQPSPMKDFTVQVRRG